MMVAVSVDSQPHALAIRRAKLGARVMAPSLLRYTSTRFNLFFSKR